MNIRGRLSSKPASSDSDHPQYTGYFNRYRALIEIQAKLIFLKPNFQFLLLSMRAEIICCVSSVVGIEKLMQKIIKGNKHVCTEFCFNFLL